MKFDKPSSVDVILLKRGALVLGLISCAASAQIPAQYDYITREEFEAVRMSFSSDRCDTQRFFAVSEALGFKPTGRQFDDASDEPEYLLRDLGTDALCLIAMSSSFQAYGRKPPNKEGVIHRTAIGPENVFPERSQVSELIFFLPKSLAPKSCATLEGATLPYVIMVEKKNGKLVRRIDSTDADEDCFIAVMKKKKLIQGQ